MSLADQSLILLFAWCLGRVRGYAYISVNHVVILKNWMQYSLFIQTLPKWEVSQDDRGFIMFEFVFPILYEMFFLWQFKTHPTDVHCAGHNTHEVNRAFKHSFLPIKEKNSNGQIQIKLLIMEILQWKIKLTRTEKCVRLLLCITSLCLLENLDNKQSFCRLRWKAVALCTLWSKLTRHVLLSKSWHCRVP